MSDEPSVVSNKMSPYNPVFTVELRASNIPEWRPFIVIDRRTKERGLEDAAERFVKVVRDDY